MDCAVPAKTSAPSLREALLVRDRQAWRAWLAQHHDQRPQVWLLLYKKHSGKRCISLAEAVEEALCFGWIDGKLYRVDHQRHILRFCPRRPRSTWSEINKARVRRLTREGRMSAAGLAAVRIAKQNGQWNATRRGERTDAIPPDLAGALARNASALRFFEGLAPSYRKMYIAWILAAKRPETKERRVRTVVERAARGMKPGIDL
jgi:uncharacterized protein YdeI (YjbR/CyaY-like superfamily)